jgi:hypothetical protein
MLWQLYGIETKKVSQWSRGVLPNIPILFLWLVSQMKNTTFVQN